MDAEADIRIQMCSFKAEKETETMTLFPVIWENNRFNFHEYYFNI